MVTDTATNGRIALTTLDGVSSLHEKGVLRVALDAGELVGVDRPGLESPDGLFQSLANGIKVLRPLDDGNHFERAGSRLIGTSAESDSAFCSSSTSFLNASLVSPIAIPGLVKIEKKKVPARAAQKGVPNPFKPGELMDRPAKPAYSKVKVRALKLLKDMAKQEQRPI